MREGNASALPTSRRPNYRFDHRSLFWLHPRPGGFIYKTASMRLISTRYPGNPAADELKSPDNCNALAYAPAAAPIANAFVGK